MNYLSYLKKHKDNNTGQKQKRDLLEETAETNFM